MNGKDTIYRQDAIDALWKALYEYEDKTEKQFIESDELDVSDWIQHRVFVQNMSDIDRKTILNLPSAEPETGRWIKEKDNGCIMWRCSECDCRIIEKPYLIATGTKGRQYCPYCGARMEG